MQTHLFRSDQGAGENRRQCRAARHPAARSGVGIMTGMVRGPCEQGFARSRKKHGTAEQKRRAHVEEAVLLNQGEQQRKQKSGDATHRSSKTQTAEQANPGGPWSVIRKGLPLEPVLVVTGCEVAPLAPTLFFLFHQYVAGHVV